MNLKVWNYFLMLGIAFVGIGDMIYSTEDDVFAIQEQVIMDMNDVITLQEEVEERKKTHEKELYFKDYKFILK